MSTLFDGLKEETVYFSMLYGLPAPSSLTFGYHMLGAHMLSRLPLLLGYGKTVMRLVIMRIVIM
jgi:hypothetical protein